MTTETSTHRTAPARLRAGWGVVASKEFADHLTSLRFVVLLVIIGIAAIVPVVISAGKIREAAQQATGIPAVFLYLFTLPNEDIPILVFTTFIGILAPLLGIAFGFDSVNAERSERTLPRLLAQPIYRDDVINGKFTAGLTTISLILVTLTGVIAGFGIFRLGIIPTGPEVLRILVWLGVTVVYVGLWLAFATLISVVVRRAATSALIAFGVWLGLTLFGGLIARTVADFLGPALAGFFSSGTTAADQELFRLQLLQLLQRLSPTTLYQEATLVILNPGAGAVDVSVPGSIGQAIQGAQQVPSLKSLDQSLLLVWPQLVILVALMVAVFAAAYVLFMRQEVRA